ncbi:MAG: site-specific DNA-methyltransferase [Holophagales bacterium]|jgi:adenine-specific DNA-methyltransferase|nr:site-specific DNA-methyltransferase [Holophagales bacterium]
MANFFDTLLEALKADKRFFAEDGTLLRNRVYEASLNMDANLIRLLLSNADIKEHFFAEVDGVLVFDKVSFGWVVNNRQFLPDSYTRFKNRIGLTNGNGDFLSTSREVVLEFPYKDCVLEGGQTKDDQKRDEVFYNETLAPDEVDRLLYPKVLVGAKRYTASGVEDSVTFNDVDNLIIKGNNLLAIASLLKRYEGKVKCIYIDPPYNPPSNANTFAYNNTFNRSSWLTFMNNRLEIAKRLLHKDGVLIVAIDKNEQPRIQILIEELFPDSDVDCITIIHNPRGVIGTNFSYTHEFAIFVTPKNKKTIGDRKIEKIDWSPFRNWGGESLRTDAESCFYPVIIENGSIVGFGNVADDDYHPKQTERHGNQYHVYPIDRKGVERKWRYAQQSESEIIKYLRAKATRNGYDIEIGKDFGTHKTVWTSPKYDANSYGTKLLKSIIPDTKFSFPKSLYTVMDCIYASVQKDKNAIILDFFGGSGTTGHAVMEINKDGGQRRFILVEQMDYVKTDTLLRNVFVMKDIAPTSSIIYCELAKCNQHFIDNVISASADQGLADLLDQILQTGFISSKVNPAKISENAGEFEALTLDGKKRFLLELLDKNMLYVNLCDMDDEEYAISDADKAFTRSFYGLGGE